MKYHAQQLLPYPPAQVFAALADARLLLTCLPRVDAVVAADADAAVWQVHGLSLLSGITQMSLAIVERQPGSLVRVGGQGTAGLGGGQGAVSMQLHAQADGTLVELSADISALTGLLGWLPTAVLNASVERVIERFWEKLRQQLA